ncbi:MAG: hypothetical protein ACRENT_07590, partial [Thermodesulfobacteriota bacterium]
LLGEATSQSFKGKNMYGIDQSGPIKDIGMPNGTEITEGTLLAEMMAMVSVVENRRRSGKFGSSWKEIASDSGAFLGYNNGNSILSDKDFAINNSAGGDICHQLYLAGLAIKTVIESGPSVPDSVLYWKAVQQGKFIRRFRPGIDHVRLAYTDFSTQN